TYNYLAYLSNNTYLEWLGSDDESVANQSDSPLIQHLIYHLENKQVGLFQFALQTDDLKSYITHFNENNIPYSGPFKGQRELTSDITITLRMVIPTYDHTIERLPFLIEWVQSGYERVNVVLVIPIVIIKIDFSGITLDRFLHI